MRPSFACSSPADGCTLNPAARATSPASPSCWTTSPPNTACGRPQAVLGGDVVQQLGDAGDVARAAGFSVQPSAGLEHAKDGLIAAWVIGQRDPVEDRPADHQISRRGRAHVIEVLEAALPELDVIVCVLAGGGQH